MITKLTNPLSVVSLGFVLSVAVGVAASWRPIQAMLEQAAIVRPSKVVTELKKKGWDFWTIEMENLASELNEERARLKKQAELLLEREARLAAEEKEFAKLRADVEALRKQIAERVIEISTDEAKNIRSLSQTYTNLTPKAAMNLISELDDTTAVKIMSLMKPDVLGPIFEEMSGAAKGSTPDPALARRAALLSDKMRLMKSSKPAPQP